MEKSRLEIKVGLFVSIGLVLVVTLMVWFSKGASLFRSTYTLRLHTRQRRRPQAASRRAAGRRERRHRPTNPD